MAIPAFIPSALAQDSLVPVSIATIQATDIYDRIPLNGTVRPIRNVQLSPLVDGAVSRVLIKQGSVVETGDALLELDTTMANIEISRVKALIVEARVRHKEAVRQRDEIIKLLARNAVADTEVARADSDVALFAAGVERLKTELNRELELLSRHTVTAPFPGVVASKMVEVGSWVDTNNAVIQLTQISTLEVEVPVPQQHFSKVSVGTDVIIQLEALPDISFSAKVTTRIPVSDNSARTFPIKIELDNAQNLIAPGMSARVILKVNPAQNVLILPKDAIVRQADGTESVWLAQQVEGNTTAVSVTVTTGRNKADWIEVNGDLKVGDKVIVHGNESLQADQKLQITEEIELRIQDT